MTVLENILSQEIVQRLGWTLLHLVWQATVIALLLAVLLAALRKSSSNVRYTVACMALGLVVLLPVVTFQLVPVSVPERLAPPSQAPVVVPIEQLSELPAIETPAVELPVPVEKAAPPAATGWRQRLSEQLEPALPQVVSGWLIGVLALSIRHMGGWTQLQRLRKRMVRPVDASLLAKLDDLAERLAITRVVELTESALVRIPTVVGWLRPVILLPASALTGLTAEQLEAILAHELAHIRRHDYLVNMIQTVVETLGFYHPAVWWVSHKIRTERENCCDDLAVSISGNRIAYARALASMEEIRSARSELAVAASGGHLLRRIGRLVAKEPADCDRVSWIPSAVALLLIVTIAIPTTLALTSPDTSDIGSPEDTQIGDKSTENIRSRPEVTKSPTPAAEDKAHVRIDCRVLEIYPSMTIDRETLISAENLLGQSVLMPAAGGKAVPRRRWPSGREVSRYWKPTVEEFIREVTGTMVSTEDTSSVTDDAQTTQKLIDLLASRGYMKILMNPTVEVVDGGTARVSSVQKVPKGKTATPSDQSDHHLDVTDYLQITPRMLDDANIKLLAEGAINIVSLPRDKEQPPTIKSTSFSTEAALKPGWSLIVGGTGAFEDDADVNATDRQLVNRLVILTPTIVNSAGPQQEKTDQQIETETAKEQPKTKEQLARSVPVLTRGPKPGGQDKPRFNFDCFVLEIYPSAKLDRESIIAAENLLGGRVTGRPRRLPDGSIVPGKPKAASVEELIRQAAGTTVWGGVPTEALAIVENDQTKPGQLNAMLDLLASRGFVKILGKSTAQACEGQHTRVTLGQSFLQIVPETHKGNKILLMTKGCVAREIPRPVSSPVVTKRTFEFQVVVDPGTRLIMGGTRVWEDGPKGLQQPQRELLFILTASAVGAETSVESRPQLRIYGRVLDSAGTPISDAGVVVHLQSDTMTPVTESVTNFKGQFKLDPIPALTEEDYGRNRYLVLAEALGHGPAWKQVHRDTQGAIVMTLKAYESAHVSGKIVTSDSKQVAGAKVWVRQMIPPELSEDAKSRANDLYVRVPLERWSATSKSDGSFRIAGVADRARIQLSVSHPDFAAIIVNVKPGKEAVIEVQPAATVTGRVLYGKTGKPAAGVKVQAQGVDHVSFPGGFMNSWAETLTDDQGRYKLESLPPNRYNIWGGSEDLTVVALDSFKVEAGQAHQAPDILLIKGGFIVGRVINEATGEPIRPGATSDVAIQGPSRPKSGAAVQSSRVREDGSFRIRVAPGRNYIYLRGGDNWRRLQVAINPPSRWFEVAAGQTVEVEFKIRKYSQAELQGLIKRGEVKFTFPKTIDEAEADNEFRRMSRLASAIALHVRKHDQTLPKTLSELKPYLLNKDDLNWAIEHVELVPKVELAQPGANHRPIAYDAALLAHRFDAYAVFGNFSVRRMRIQMPKQMGIHYGSRPVAAPADRWIVLHTTMKMYAKDHDGKLPDTLDALKPYVVGERYVEWIADNVEYLSPGGHLNVMQNWVPIACQKEQFANDQFTMVLFADGRTESTYPAKIKRLMQQDVPLDLEQINPQNTTLPTPPPLDSADPLPKKLQEKLELSASMKAETDSR